MKNERFVGEVVELTAHCDLGAQGERAVVLHVFNYDSYKIMELVFMNRPGGTDQRIVRTGIDYRFCRSV